ncbi:MAG TPA: IclR family transcriptional regulator [Candidatus Limnocylindrales bacterium]|jgi:DNA-binding IclR family transcriptional regulator|nr:IclR family transcriptional regulator [Candidatus Limnocylindrales bacterium]
MDSLDISGDGAPEGARGTETRSVVALRRGLAILDAFSADRRELGVNELGRMLGLHKSTVSRLCVTLEDAGYLARDPLTEKYRLGARIQQLTGASTTELRGAARDVLMQLVETLSETVTMVVRDGSDIVTIEVIDGPRMVRMQARVGARTQLHASAGAKAILAWLEPQALGQLIDDWPLTRLTANSITTRAELLEHLAATRERGYSIDHEELEIGLRCVGAPIRDHNGDVIAGIAVSAARHRMADAEIARFGDEVRQAADAISSRLGAPILPVAAPATSRAATRRPVPVAGA